MINLNTGIKKFNPKKDERQHEPAKALHIEVAKDQVDRAKLILKNIFHSPSKRYPYGNCYFLFPTMTRASSNHMTVYGVRKMASIQQVYIREHEHKTIWSILDINLLVNCFKDLPEDTKFRELLIMMTYTYRGHDFVKPFKAIDKQWNDESATIFTYHNSLQPVVAPS